MERPDSTDTSLTAPPPGDQRGAELSSSRMWSQPGPSSGQGYCGFCKVLYRNLEQHLSSLGHLDAVRISSSSRTSSTRPRTTTLLLERFLRDVLLHHPHRYGDTRPSHADLPSVSAPPSPRKELDEVCLSENGSRSLSTREHLPSSGHTSPLQSANQQEMCHNALSQSAGGVSKRLSTHIRERDDQGPARVVRAHLGRLAANTPPSPPLATPSVHRKAHRKTNRRKTSDSSHSEPRPHPSQQRWQWERKRVELSSEHSDAVDRTIEEVIQLFCHDVTSCQKKETESVHVSLSGSQSDEWDAAVQVTQDSGLSQGRSLGQDLGHLLDLQVDLEDQAYSQQLDSALSGRRGILGGTKTQPGFWTVPIEDVLPVPEHIPQAFWGKSWAEIEQEDEKKVERLVGQFRRGKFVCYFDSDSLARYGRRSQWRKKGCGESEVAEQPSDMLPLLDIDEPADRKRKRRRRRSFRLASRCQVVKVSHSTQTVRLVIPAVRQAPPETPPTSAPAAIQEAAERTPESWLRVPPSCSSVVSPVQPHTSVLYLLGSPSGPAPVSSPGSASKRCRRKRRPLDLQGLKVKYKPLPVRFYDLSTNRVLNHAPKGFLWPQHLAPSVPPPACVRQLFRSLSPELNADRMQGEGPQGHTSSAVIKVRRGRLKPKVPPPQSRPERGRGGRKQRPHPLSSRPRTRTQVTPGREGLRRGGSALLPPSSRPRRSRRGQS